MLKFFRKTRLRLLSENQPAGRTGRFTKYLVYAFGEITLVVIGILIALQINNWNEWKKDRNDEQIILKSLRKEFQDNQIGVQDVLLRYRRRFQGIDSLMLLIGQRRISEIELEDIRSIRTLFTHYTWNPEMSTIEGLLSSGQIAVLQNKELEHMILTWTALIDDFREDDAKVVEISNQWVPYLSKVIPLYDVFSNPKTSGEQRRLDLRKSDHRIDKSQIHSLTNEVAFFNLLGQRRWWMDIKVLNAEEIDQHITRVLELIDSEIDK